MKKVLFLLSFIISQHIYSQCLSGSYTIGGATPDFPSLTSAVNALTANGVCGPVIFNIRSGIYYEQISISPVTGSSATNTITFQSESLDSTQVTIQATGLGTSSNYVVRFNGCDFIKIHKLKLKNTATGYSTCVRYQTSSDNTELTNCILESPNATSIGTNKVIISSTNDNENCIIANNTFYGGTYAINFTGTSNVFTNFIISGNSFSGQFEYGVYLYNVKSPKVLNNSFNYGPILYDAICTYGTHDSAVFSGNKINCWAGGDGINIASSNGNAFKNILISNNVINSSSDANGITINSVTNAQVYHNTVVLNSNSLLNYCFSTQNTSNSVVLKNNIFYQKGVGRIYSSTTNGNYLSDYNDLYCQGQIFANYNGSDYYNINSFKTASGKDINSLNYLPQFVSSSDFHISSDFSQNLTLPFFSSVSNDIDGVTRDNASPYFGAYEYFNVTNSIDAGVTRLVSPISQNCVGSIPVKATIKNYSSIPLASVNINWSLNGIIQTPFSWSGNLNYYDTTSVTIGNAIFTNLANNSINVWTSSPNNSTDVFNLNDTIKTSNLYSRMSGIYTVGGTTPDFNNLSAAITSIQNRGVCGNVILNIRPGLYNEYITIPSINGLTGNNTLTIQSENNINSSVTVYYTGSGQNVFKLNGADNVIIKNITIGYTNAPLLPLISLAPSTDNLEITNCIINSISQYAIHGSLTSGSIEPSKIKIYNNTFNAASYCIRLESSNPNSLRFNDVKIKDNIFNTTTWGMTYLYGIDTLEYISNNFVNANVAANCASFWYVTKADIRKNKFYANNYSAFELRESSTILVANNMFVTTGTTNIFSVNINTVTSLKFINNSINCSNTNPSTKALNIYQINSPLNQTRFWNNAIVNTGQGSLIYMNSAINFRNNAYYGKGPILWTYVSNYSNINTWKNTTQNDTGSIFVNPLYNSISDLHVNEYTLKAAGTSVSSYISDDYDGQTRNVTTPDIGADEFTPLTLDAGTNDLDIGGPVLCTGSLPLKVYLKNNGTTTLTSAKINSLVNSTSLPIYNWSGSLAPGMQTLVNFGSYNFVSNTSYTLKVWSSDPNNQIDVLSLNDSSTKSSISAGLSGTYTIGGATPDFANIASAVNYISTNGICGPVVFNLRNGVYNEQIKIPNIRGNSSINTITFQSESLDSSLVSIEFNATSGMNYVINIDSLDNIIFNKIGFKALNSTYSGILWFSGKAKYSQIKNCVFTAPSTAGTLIIFANGSDSSTVTNCKFSKGNTAIQFIGNSQKIIKNSFDSQNVYSINAQGLSFELLSNSINMPSGTAINIAAGSNGKISKNKIVFNSYNNTSRGINIISNTTSIDVINNFVSINGGNGIHLQSLNNGNIINNSVYQIGNGYCLSFSNSTNTSVLNNILYNTTQNAYCMQVYGTNTNCILNYNCIYNASGNTLIYYVNTPYSSLSSYNLATGYEANSISIDPLFNSYSDLHTPNAIGLDSKATVNLLVTDDIDGQLRSATPDIGADEFVPLNILNDAQVLLSYFDNSTCGGVKTLYAKIKNIGTDTLKSLKLTANYLGTTYTPVVWNGSLLQGQIKDSIVVATVNNAYGINPIKVWSELPNGVADPITTNDTISNNSQALKLIGAYTIGGNNPVFSTINLAKNALTTYGVCGAVVMNIRAGTYSEVINFTSIAGVSAINAVTFQSELLDSSTVIINGNGTAASTINNNGANYLIFKKLTITSTYTSNLNNLIYITATNNQISNCKIYRNSNLDRLIFISGLNSKILNNYLSGGFSGIYINGNSNGAEISNNQLNNQTNVGFESNNAQITKFNSNSIFSNVAINTFKGVSIINNSTNISISQNKIDVNNGYGMEISNTNGLIYNNAINVVPITTNTECRGIAVSSSNSEIYNNTISFNHNYITSSAFYVSSGSNTTKIKYNIIVNKGSGYAYNIVNIGLIQSDSNCYYSNGKNPFKLSTTNYSNLNAFKLASSKDANSMFKLPYFVQGSYYKIANDFDLYNRAAKVSYITNDIDFSPRNNTASCVGANEYSLLNIDGAIDKILLTDTMLCDNLTAMIVRVRNNGITPLTQLTIGWKFNGVTQATYNWTGNLLSGDSAIVNIGNYNPSITSSNSIIAYCSQPNSVLDINNVNDTATINNISSKMIGIYTIGGSSPDFSTFTSAVNKIATLGVCGAVTFKVRDGSYDERIQIPVIKGASYVNTITFESESGDSSKVILFTNPATNPSSFPCVVTINSNHIYLKKITIKNLSIHNIQGVYANNVRDILISNCDIQLNGGNHAVYYSAPVSGNVKFKILNNNFPTGVGNLLSLFKSNSNALTKPSDIVISGNKFGNTAYRSMVLGDFDSVVVSNNEFQNVVEIDKLGSNFRITKNKFLDELKLSNIDTSSSANRLISNNFMYYCHFNGASNIKFYNNTVVRKSNIIYTGNSIGQAPCLRFSEFSRGNIIKNNIFHNTCSPVVYVFYNTTPMKANAFDYNNLYSIGDTVALGELPYYNCFTNLFHWQTSHNQDLHSIRVKSNFVSTTDYHLNNDVNINNTGTPLADVPDDYDGNIRNNITPDIGADEFNATPLANDAYLVGYNASTPMCEGTNSFNLQIKNNGSNALTTLTINWKMNGTNQTPFNWSGSLLPGATTFVNIGNANVSANALYSFIFYSTNPNGQNDPNKLNDTIKINNIRPKFNGAYTIGGISPSFNTFNSAISALMAVGVCGPVEFLARDGAYYEMLTIYPVIGTSATNTVTFRSQSGNKSGVVIGTNTNWSYDGLEIIDAKHIVFKDLTFINSTDYNNVLSIKGTAGNIVFTNNVFDGTPQNPSTPAGHPIIEFTGKSDSCLIANNIFKRGGYGVFFNSSSLSKDNIVRKNIIDEPYNFGIYIKNQQNIAIDSNVINKTNQNSSAGSSSGIIFNSNTGFYKIENNTINGEFNEGISIYWSNGNASSYPIIANNAISGGVKTIYGINISSSYLKLYYNSVNVISTINYSTAFKFSSSYIVLNNNQFINQGQGYSMMIDVGSTVTTSDYNNLFTTGLNLVKVGSFTNYTTLAAYQSATNKDLNSISVNPQFISQNDLHYTNTSIDGKATPLAEVTRDLQNIPRHVTTPNIGAYEGPATPIVDSINKYLVLTKINTPSLAIGSNLITATIAYKPDPVRDTNYYSCSGTIDSLRMHYKVNHFPEVVETWYGSLSYKDSLTYTFNTPYNVPNGKLYDVKVWFENLNPNHVEVNLADDSLTKRFLLPMIGNYTVGGILPDFPNYTSTFLSLLYCGSSGDVKFLFRPGSYGRVTYETNNSYPNHNGLISYTSETGNADDVIIDLHWLNDLDSMKFSSLTIHPITQNSISYTDDGVQIGQTYYTEFDSCKFIGGTLPNERGGLFFFNHYGGVVSTIRNCTFKNLRYAINISNFQCYSTADPNRNFIFENNTIDSCDRGILIKNYTPWVGKKLIIKNNTISTITHALEVTHDGCSKVEINNNYFTSNYHAIYINPNNEVTNTVFTNNMVASNGINYINKSNSIELYNNSFNTTTQFKNVSNSIKLYNNIFSTDSTFNALEVVYPSPITIYSDNNNYYAPNYSTFARVGKDTYPYKLYYISSIQQFKDSVHTDSNSVNFNPLYISNTDLHSQAPNLQGLAKPFAFVTEDIDGDSRLINAPDIGADEINLFLKNVWPGDANFDSIVNNTDILALGLYYGENGYPRNNISNLWQAHYAPDWATNQVNGSNKKHADCNGDGVINLNDTLAVNLNFSLTHTLASPSSGNISTRSSSDLYFVTANNFYNAGDWVDVDIYLGSPSNPVVNIYGIAFNINYDVSLVQPGTETIIYQNNWLAQPGIDAIKINKIDAIAGTAYGALTRIDHTNKSGNGKIATFRFKIKNSILQPTTLNFSYSGYMANDASGQLLTFNTIPDSIIAYPLSTNIDDQNDFNKVDLFPNPYYDNFSIYYTLPHSSKVVIEIYNAFGQIIKTIVNDNQQAGNYYYSINDSKQLFEAGIYYVKIAVNDKSQIRKIVKL